MKILLAAVAIVLSVSAAHATSVSWTFQGNLVAGGSVPDLVGDVTITLDDEDTAGSVKVRIDASGLAAGEFIRNVYFTTDFNVEVAPFLLFTPPGSFPSYFDYDANEDGFNPIDGITADARIGFTESPDPEFDNGAGLFEGVFERDGLDVSFFLTNDGGAPYEIAIQARGLTGGSGGNYFFGTRVEPEPPGTSGTSGYITKTKQCPVTGTPLLPAGSGYNIDDIIISTTGATDVELHFNPPRTTLLHAYLDANETTVFNVSGNVDGENEQALNLTCGGTATVSITITGTEKL